VLHPLHHVLEAHIRRARVAAELLLLVDVADEELLERGLVGGGLAFEPELDEVALGFQPT
jgi:hypothetical protein